MLFDPATAALVIDDEGSPNDLHGITVTDDLNATGAVLSYVSHTAYWEGRRHAACRTRSRTSAGSSPSSSAIRWSSRPGEQFVIELTVVLEDVPANAIGTQFVNTAKWEFGRLIDGVFYEPLPGEWGISPPLTIAAPELVVDKTGPATMNLGETGQFTDRRAELRALRRLERHAGRPAAERADGRHVRR